MRLSALVIVVIVSILFLSSPLIAEHSSSGGGSASSSGSSSSGASHSSFSSGSSSSAGAASSHSFSSSANQALAIPLRISRALGLHPRERCHCHPSKCHQPKCQNDSPGKAQRAHVLASFQKGKASSYRISPSDTLPEATVRICPPGGSRKGACADHEQFL